MTFKVPTQTKYNLRIKKKNSHITHHLAQLDNTSASILVSSNCLDNSCLGLHPNLFLHLKQQIIINTRHCQQMWCVFHHSFCWVSDLPHLGLSGLCLLLVHGPAGVHSWPGVPADATGQNRVPAPVLLLHGLFVTLCHLTQRKTQVSIPTAAILCVMLTVLKDCISKIWFTFNLQMTNNIPGFVGQCIILFNSTMGLVSTTTTI